VADEQPFFVLDLYAVEPVLHDGPRIVREGAVKFGRPVVVPAADADLPDVHSHRLDIREFRFVKLSLPFDLEEPPVKQRYIDATVRMVFDDEDVLSVTMAGQTRPPATMRTWGLRRPELTWGLRVRDKGRGIEPGGHQAEAVVEFPMKTTVVTGSLDARAEVAREVLGITRHAHLEPRRPWRFVITVEDDRIGIHPGSAADQ
jgi:hypothetical protein